MKKKLQKYLSGSNEGFSLVELIIVIAIMAILIGVVALAVIPYLEKSRESKDLESMSALAKQLAASVADTKATGEGTITFNPSGNCKLSNADTAGTNAADVRDSMKEIMGDKEIKLSSTVGADRNVICYYNTAKSIVVVYVAQHDASVGGSSVAAYDGGSNVQTCKYNDHAPLMVTG